ncbi:MAG: hypothetical protein CSA19_00010 [Deltaproteobacteria bacterium]|nr:MAG: hypothetical protein CSA19_00010 [Deltaproteobacteria bacterium]
MELAIQAVKESRLPLKLIISGTGEYEKQLMDLAQGDSRIEFRGHISDEELKDLYAGALAVPFLPIREDYGYVTLEAFASSKPVITCTDSGEPARMVTHGNTGLLCRPEVESVRGAMEEVFQHGNKARQMGMEGKKLTDSMSWDTVARTLLAEAELSAAGVTSEGKTSEQSSLNVAVFDMQPIDPPVGGGRQRLLGLYHHLGPERICHYTGTYDWQGESFREQWLSDSLQETLVPLSSAHHSAATALSAQCHGKVVIDMSFSSQAELSPEWIDTARNQLAKADVVIFSHPWVYPLLADRIQPHQVLVYDSHNVEGYLRAQLLDETNPMEAQILERAVEDEYHCGLAAHLILACSHEDLTRFNRIYEFAPEIMRIVPNGIMAQAVAPADHEERLQIRQDLGLNPETFIAVFIGSAYGPNIQAAQFIVEHLAPALPHITFVIIGGAGTGVISSPDNLICTGPVSEEDKIRWFKAADMAVNPMFAGSGTNIKMFDFMALGLPTVTTVTGARGIEFGGDQPFLTVGNSSRDMIQGIEFLRDHPDYRKKMGQAARKCVMEGYAWEQISYTLGEMLHARAKIAGQPRPEFSVIIPTFDRHAQLEEVMNRLSAQTERDFEVIIVDQTPCPWPGRHQNFGIPVTYYHTSVKGAVRARNTGAALSSGRILAFTDDDCQPRPEWLLNARPYFADASVVGVEGRIESDHPGDPNFRRVSNVGSPGIGFRTANLMVRSAVFQLAGGFDLQFDLPHFREDTDLGWRLQTFGQVPYADDVLVFHPALPRDVERESVEARAIFFQKDALLYQKHPEKYETLFFLERHFETYPGFSEQLITGFEKTNQSLPDWMLPWIMKDTKSP